MKRYIPLLITIDSARVLIVGGGKAAALKARGVARFTHNITVVSPELKGDFSQIDFSFIAEHYTRGTALTYDLVYACTDDLVLNREIGQECQQHNILCAICGDSELSSFASPATYINENITISVGTGGSSPRQAIFIRNQIEKLIEEGVIQLNR